MHIHSILSFLRIFPQKYINTVAVHKMEMCFAFMEAMLFTKLSKNRKIKTDFEKWKRSAKNSNFDAGVVHTRWMGVQNSAQAIYCFYFFSSNKKTVIIYSKTRIFIKTVGDEYHYRKMVWFFQIFSTKMYHFNSLMWIINQKKHNFCLFCAE